MNEKQIPMLQHLFSEAEQELDGKDLTAQVMVKTRRANYLFIGGGIAVSLLALTITWLLFAIPLLDFAVLVSEALTATLLDLGEGWLALVFLPVNNIASLMVISAKLIHQFRKKILSYSFSG